uniref:Fe2OG dioxygenase domain-containing protein n=1 Tax=Arundo donax TaxID=35708 RepID=A0A0A9FF03_ARUDO
MESLPVPSVQEMVAATDGADVPPRYLRPEETADPIVAGDIDAEIPVIDFQRLLDPDASHEESARLHGACQDWGFFQLINHGVPSDVVEGMKENTEGFFRLPAETKKQVAQERRQLEGYGHLFVVSEDQKLDWSDVLFLNTQPPQGRNMRFWPDRPCNFRSILDKYSTAAMNIVERLLAIMAKNMGLEPGAITDKFIGGIQSVRMNYYPPCAQAEKVIGLSPHSDAGLLTLVLQVNQVKGLQIRRNGSWVPVKPLDGALIVNLGDTFEIFTNGRYRSVEHRVVVDTDKERLSIAAFHAPNMHAKIGPLKEIVAHEAEVYKTVDHENFRRLFFSAKLVGKSFLERMKLKSSS